MSLVISGRIVAMSKSGGAPEDAVAQGKVWIADNGIIAAVTAGNNPGPAGFGAATAVDVGQDLVLPGLIDLHSHLAYATLPLWIEPNRTAPYLHHNQWPKQSTYSSRVTWPAYAFIEASPAELLAYAEVRAVVGGTTSIQGSPPKNRPLDGWFVRNVEDETLTGTVGSNRVLASTLTLDNETLAKRSGQMTDGATFIYHCAEGQPGSGVKGEFKNADDMGCLQSRMVAIHTNAVDPTSYGEWTPAGTIVWSPFSNLWLYGSTTDIPAAIAKGIRICIGSDWGPSGTRNVLGELKVGSLVSDKNGWGLKPFDLVKMVTANPGDVIKQAWNTQAGRLEPNALGDVTVLAADNSVNPFDRILKATEQHIKLVVIRGRAVYGDTQLMNDAGAGPTPLSSIKLNGQTRSLALPLIDDPKKAWSFVDVMARLDAVKKNPKKEIEEAQARRHLAFAGLQPGQAPPLRLALDMPTGLAPIGGLPKDLNDVVVPTIQPFEHDAAFFTTIAGHTVHNHVLDGLEAFYK